MELPGQASTSWRACWLPGYKAAAAGLAVRAQLGAQPCAPGGSVGLLEGSGSASQALVAQPSGPDRCGAGLSGGGQQGRPSGWVRHPPRLRPIASGALRLCLLSLCPEDRARGLPVPGQRAIRPHPTRPWAASCLLTLDTHRPTTSRWKPRPWQPPGAPVFPLF